MIAGTINKTIKKALTSFSQKEQVPVKDIALFIHTKDGECTPKYFYTVAGQLKRDENGNMIDLDLKKDILQVGIDFLGKEMMTTTFLKNYLSNTSKEHEIHSTRLYVQICSADEELTELQLALLDQMEEIKKLTLQDVFGE